ncbi:MAG: hypothetical protein SVW57_02670 [Thermodesulfobacteriota bacterium]|nr:hypothetical protein [Thermodesulfobacteriota bacterium]
MKIQAFLTQSFLIFLFILGFFQRESLCQEFLFTQEATQSHSMTIKSVALLPLENLSGSNAPAPDIISHIGNNLEKKMITIIPHDKVEDFLIKERIRGTSFITKAISRQMGETLNVDGIILTRVDLLAFGEDPKIGIGCRMISGHDGDLIWANHVTLAGSDFTSWFGLGKIRSLETLTEIAVDNLLVTFPKEVEKKKSKPLLLKLQISQFTQLLFMPANE